MTRCGGPGGPERTRRRDFIHRQETLTLVHVPPPTHHINTALLSHEAPTCLQTFSFSLTSYDPVHKQTVPPGQAAGQPGSGLTANQKPPSLGPAGRRDSRTVGVSLKVFGSTCWQQTCDKLKQTAEPASVGEHWTAASSPRPVCSRPTVSTCLWLDVKQE